MNIASIRTRKRPCGWADSLGDVRTGLLGILIVAHMAAAPAWVHAQQVTPVADTAASARVASASRDAVQMLNPGDKLQITVFRMPELSGEFLVASDGTVAHPVYHTIVVTGVPLDTVHERIRTVLLRLQTRPQFVLQPLFRVAVGGEVRQPNLYSLPPETTVAQAVAQAGGVTPDGRLDHVQLMRDGTTYTVDLARPSMAMAQMRVHSGDQIQVERRESRFRNYIVPLGSVIAGVAGLVGLMLR